MEVVACGTVLLGRVIREQRLAMVCFIYVLRLSRHVDVNLTLALINGGALGVTYVRRCAKLDARWTAL